MQHIDSSQNKKTVEEMEVNLKRCQETEQNIQSSLAKLKLEYDNTVKELAEIIPHKRSASELDGFVFVSFDEDLPGQSLITQPLKRQLASLEYQIRNMLFDLVELRREISNLRLTEKILEEDHIAVDRLIAGAGATATLLYTEFSETDRTSTSKSGVPNLLALGHTRHPQHWSLHGTSLMGQPQSLQTADTFTTIPSHLPHSVGYTPERNPYRYVPGLEYDRALIQNQSDLKMNIASFDIIDIQKKDTPSAKQQNDPPWDNQFKDYSYRVKIQKGSIVKFVYTHHIDICTGLGVARKLQEGTQVETAVARDLERTNRLIYAQDASDPQLTGDILIYGGGAICGMIVDDITRGGKETVKNVKWVAQSEKHFSDTERANRMYRDFFSRPDSDKILGVGDLKRVSIDPGTQKIKVEFNAPKQISPSSKKENLADQAILCDQLVVGIGALGSVETALKSDTLKQRTNIEFTSCLSNGVPIGTQSSDGAIVSWGIAGSQGFGCEARQAETHSKLAIQHAETLPFEAATTGTLFRNTWAVHELARTLKVNKHPPFSFVDHNINYAPQAALEKILQEAHPMLKKPETLSKKSETAKTIDRAVTAILALRKNTPTGIKKIEELSHIPMPSWMRNALAKHYFIGSRHTMGWLLERQKEKAPLQPKQQEEEIQSGSLATPGTQDKGKHPK